MIDAGRILIIPRGEWTNLESYEMLDLVTRGDIAYIARQASVGVDPATDTQLTYWQPFGTAAKIATTTGESSESSIYKFRYILNNSESEF